MADSFEIELKIGFLDEASQALTDVEQCFLSMELDPDNIENINKIFRLAHNLKGSSKAVGFDEMGAFTHEFETFILKIKTQEISPNPAVISLLLRANDYLVRMVDGLKQNLDARFDSVDLLTEMKKLSEGNAQVVQSETQEQVPETEGSFPLMEEIDENELIEETETLSKVSDDQSQSERIDQSANPEKSEVKHPLQSETKLEAVLPQTSDRQETNLNPGTKSVHLDETLRVSVSKLENLLNFIGEMVILQSVMREQVAKTDSLLLKKTARQMEKVSKEIQDLSMGLRMVPVKSTFQKMQRIVRDTAKALNKEVNLVLLGEETELDKTVLEKINDPLVHLIRNSVDHGIESSEMRTLSGKSSKGQVTLSAFHQSGKLCIEVKDDGGGLDPEKLKKKAIEKGILKPNASLSDKEAFNLIFAAGFSTKDQVTDVSGRGVGMDVVRTNIQELSGEILIDSVKGVGTSFKIILPLTLAIIDGMTVSFSGEKYVIPLVHVHETLQPLQKNIQKTSGLGEILMLRGENLPLYRLGDFFGIQSSLANQEMIALVIRTNQVSFAVLVDDILGQYQVVVKQLGRELENQKGISGSTILGDGRPALILEPVDLTQRKIVHLGQKKPIVAESAGSRVA